MEIYIMIKGCFELDLTTMIERIENVLMALKPYYDGDPDLEDRDISNMLGYSDPTLVDYISDYIKDMTDYCAQYDVWYSDCIPTTVKDLTQCLKEFQQELLSIVEDQIEDLYLRRQYADRLGF
jgi:hypothetical protein